MKLLICSDSKFISARPQIAVWSVPKTSVVNDNLSIGGGNEDL